MAIGAGTLGAAGTAAALAAALALTGCEPGIGGPPIGDCPAEDVFRAADCQQTYCGEPVVRLGSGDTRGHEPVGDGDATPVWFGPQGGYHLFVSAEMENLCPVVFLRYRMEAEVRRAGTVLLYEGQRHVQAVRPDPERSSLQRYWNLQAVVPCEWWPDDPDPAHEVQDCTHPEAGRRRIEDVAVRLWIEVEDHNGRLASDEALLDPFCCQDVE